MTMAPINNEFISTFHRSLQSPRIVPAVFLSMLMLTLTKNPRKYGELSHFLLLRAEDS